jgi:hypothetical protein
MPLAEGGSWRRAKTACRVASLSAKRPPIYLLGRGIVAHLQDAL